MAACLALALLSLSLLSTTLSVQVSKEDYTTWTQLEESLLSSYSNNSVPNLFLLKESFFPSDTSEPFCVPVQYNLLCASQGMDCDNCVNCTQSGFVKEFLWTSYNVNEAIGAVLLSYAYDGIELAGFNSWENACFFSDWVSLTLNLSVLTYNEQDIVLKSLTRLTSQLKKYAASQGQPRVGDSSNLGYAISWSKDDQFGVLQTPSTILTAVFIFLNIFIYLLSFSMTNYTYDHLYENVKHKKNPGYPLFWGLVVFCFCWNVAPSWLVIIRFSDHVKYSLFVMIPLQFIASLVIKKKTTFPVPGLSPKGCPKHHSETESFHIWEHFKCWHCFVNHTFQIFALWNILVTFTFLVYYLSAVIVTFYLYPTSTIIKLVFVKATAVCVMLVFALLFSESKFRLKCTCKALKHDCITVFTLIAVITFLPILAYLAFIIGGIIFSENATSGLQSVLTILPSVFLILIAWASRGHLFPKGIHDSDPVKEAVSDLEKGATQNDHDGSNKNNTSGSPEHEAKSPVVDSYQKSESTPLLTRRV